MEKELQDVAPSQVRELKLNLNAIYHIFYVAPSQVRELKLWIIQKKEMMYLCRTFTGAWIETNLPGMLFLPYTSHLHRCVNWNHII